MPRFSQEYQQLATAVRALAVDQVEAAQSGHPGAPLGFADVATVLWADFLKFNPDCPTWAGRDRFILSNGHASALQYALLYLTNLGAPGHKPTLDDLRHFRQLGHWTAGHPEADHPRGVETTTGPLGQGLATAVGMALADQRAAAQGDTTQTQRKTYVVVGDGCLMEGLSHEALELAGHWRLHNLVVLFDDNGISIDGPTALAVSTDHSARLAAYGFTVLTCDGHHYASIYAALQAAQASDKPVFIRCKTHIGWGTSRQDLAKAHGEPLGAEIVAQLRQQQPGWPAEPFTVDPTALALWRACGTATHTTPQQAYTPPAQADLHAALAAVLPALTASAMATRKASQICLGALQPLVPSLVLGSADLTPSNLVNPPAAKPLQAGQYQGQYLHYGVREHAMGAVMNGLALAGPTWAVGATFLSFLDYLKPALRLSALMRTKVTYVFTHDSIGLGEDGPTHQPIEHLAMLRAIPGVLTLRPADAIETAEAWLVAAAHPGPTVLVLSRQNVSLLRTPALKPDTVACGGYILQPEAGPLQGVFIATGSEVTLALAAQAELSQRGIHTRVVSLPSWELFRQQPAAYRHHILPPTCTARVAIEAAHALGWHEWVGATGRVVGMTTFGASGKAADLYQHFGITAAAAAQAMEAQL